MDTLLAIDLGQLARDINLPHEKVVRTVELLDQGNTVPFITRYRKDHTGGLDEEHIRSIQENVVKMRLLAERKQTILKSIESQGKLTEDLANQIKAAQSPKRLEDLYLPYKPKKQTLATLARERGLEPLAREVFEADPAAADLDARAADFVNPDRGLHSRADVLLGVGHLIAERLSERAELRARLRKVVRRTGRLVTTRIEPVEKPAAASPPRDTPEVEAETAAEPNDGGSATNGPGEAPVLPEATAGGGAVAPALLPAETAAAEDPASAAADEAAGEDSTPGENEAAAGESGVAAGPASESAAEESACSADSGPAPSAEAAVPAAGGSPRGPTPASRESKKRKKHKKEKERKENAFKDYFQYQEPLGRVPPHRVLAINRGERAKVLRVKIDVDFDAMCREAEECCLVPDHPHAEFLRACLRDSLSRLLVPSLEREVRRELTERAETHAVEVFARNLRKLLLAPPLRGRRVLALDPGFRSGCKLAALDEFGNVLGHGMIHLVGSQERRRQSRARLVEMVKLYRITAVAIGNGTACRETEKLVADALAEELKEDDVGYVIVNEAGASVYSTSPIGREELPGYDATLRGAVSIGRRMLDPLSELVKINPANIGVGLYQHDVQGRHLRSSLDAVVESCVNYVGVDVNTASVSLLRYVSGLNQLTARRLYDHRRQHGPFRTREQLKDVPGMGEATYIQAAGFLKISDGDNALDATWIHPESYEVVRRVADKLSLDLNELVVRASRPRHYVAAPAEPAAMPESPPHAAAAAAAEGVAPPPGAASAEAPALPESSAAAASDPSPAAEAAVAELPPPPPIAQPAKDGPAPTGEAVADRSAVVYRLAEVDVPQLAVELGVGELLLRDILSALSRPGRDPRDDLPAPVFRREIIKLEDLKPGMELTGTVLNVVDFGAFVDIGLSDSGLIHISRLADRYVRDPHEVVSVGDTVRVWVVEVDKQRRRVSLTAVQPGTERPAAARQPRERSQGRPPPQQPAGSGPPPAGARTGQRSGPPSKGRPPRPAADRRPHARPPKYASFERRPRAPKPVVPITKAMEEGREPMRTFADLMQFYEKKKTEDGSDDEAGG
jgi:uncharacterized protein